MSLTTVNILKKNRVYFSCENNKGFRFKLRIDKNSENLSVGQYELFLKDVSVKSKYGTDFIYEVVGEFKPEEIVSLKHRYNVDLVNSCRELGGKWVQDEKAWIFPAIVADKVEELDWLYNTDLVDIEITFTENKYSQPSVLFKGYVLATASGRDSGATLGDNVHLISGKIFSSGSIKNWVAEIEEGTIFRMNISRNLLTDFNPDYLTYKILS